MPFLKVAICVEQCYIQKLCSVLSVGYILYLRSHHRLLGMGGGQVPLAFSVGAGQHRCHPLILKGVFTVY